MIDIRAYLSTERVTVLKSRTKDGAIMELVALAAKSPAVEDAEKTILALAMGDLSREELFAWVASHVRRLPT